ncbi:hypothetical protein KCP75_20690 [Salmonella enterica subsp. enterica]|nr:hypothetical protein KCP75_20690 [Salmonella enterica subsp. enterica]
MRSLEICIDVTVFRDGQFIAGVKCALTEDSLIEMMVGRSWKIGTRIWITRRVRFASKVDNLCPDGRE